MIFRLEKETERSDLENNSLADVPGNDHYAVGHRPIVRHPVANIEFKRLLQVRHHRRGSVRPPDEERVIALTHEPARQPKIRKADHVVRVQVGQEYPVDVLPSNLDLGKALQRASTSVEDKSLPPSLYQDARPESIHGGHRRAGAKERHPDLLGSSDRWTKRHQGKGDNHGATNELEMHAVSQ